MKKIIALACVLSAFTLSSFAQTAASPADAGAKLVAERDAAWAKGQPRAAAANESTAPAKAKSVKHAKKAKAVKHAKKAKHVKKAKAKAV
jgi:hypothetical protein